MEQFALTLDGLLPHGACLLWRPGLLYLHVAANALIALAYLFIPFAIFHFVRRRPDIHFKFLHWQFAAFILLCGLTHLMSIVTLWWPLYWLQGAIMAATALISLFVAVLAWKLIPILLSVPSSADLQRLNSRLQGEIAEKAALMDELRREVLKTEHVSQEKSAFLSSVSHEIRTPMNGIIGIAELLEDTHLDQEQQNFVHTILQSAHTLLGLINDILDFSKIEAGKLNLEHIAFDPVQVAENCALIVAPRAYEKKLSLVCHIAPDIPCSVLGDPTRVTQILLNLLNNAVKFTQHGEVVLRVEKDLAGGGRVQLRFSVADTGIGIAAGQMEQLFEPFTQADTSTSRLYGGTGLGLSICKRLAKLMGGGIGADSREGVGSTFWVHLPGELAEGRAPAAVPPALPRSVLLVGGSDALRESVRSRLLHWGSKISEIATTELMLDRLAASNEMPMLLLLEQHNSAALLKLAKQAQALDGAHVALVLALPDVEAAAECKAAGIALAVQPVTRRALAELFSPPALPESAAAGEAADTRPAISASTALETGCLILLAEDNRVNQVVALSLLKKLGHSAHVVENGREAVEAASRLAYGLILMDCQMPVMDGFAATQLIRQEEVVSGRHIPIIAMTANAMAGDRERCLAAGMDDYLSKPVGIARLGEILDVWLPKNPPLSEPALTREVLNWSRLREFFDEDEDGMREALQVFLRAVPERIDHLFEAIAQRDGERTIFVLNDFLASSESMGAVRLVELLHRMLADARPKRWEALARYETLLDEQQRLLTALLEQQPG